MKFKAAVILFLGVVACGVQADGKLYRWVDAAGSVHFSDQPVANAQEVEAKSVAGSTPPSPPSAKSDDSQASAQECQRKRDQLGSYRTSSSVTETDGLGNAHTYTPEERQKLIEITEKSMHDACGSS